MSETFRYLEDKRYTVVPIPYTTDETKTYRVSKLGLYMGWIQKADSFFFARHSKDDENMYKRFFSIHLALDYIIQQDKIHNG